METIALLVIAIIALGIVALTLAYLHSNRTIGMNEIEQAKAVIR